MDFYGERLYYDVERVIGEHLEQVTEATVVPAFMNSSIDVGTTADAGAGFLKTVEKVWDDFTTGLDLIQQVFYYLVKTSLQ
jgi:cullin 3